MKTYYIRHTRKMDVDAATLNHLWDNHLVGIHFPDRKRGEGDGISDNDSLDPQDYVRSGVKAMKVLTTLGREGGYVLAEYCHQPGCLIGEVQPGTPVSLYRGNWGLRSKRAGREAVLKTLPVARWQITDRMQSVKLLVTRPRMGTAMCWTSVGKLVENLVTDNPTPPSLGDLTPTFQEVMCSEYLRLSNTGLPQLVSLVVPVGRTLRDLDIYGLSRDGGIIVGQVTYQPSAHCPEKLSALAAFARPELTRIFFCGDTVSRVEGDIHFVPLGKVYADFTSSPIGRRWLQEISS